MQRPKILLLVLLLYDPGTFTWGEGSSGKSPLDLPAGGRGSTAEDEDAPEIIEFYASQYEGDAFFFLIDKSGSMLGEQFDILKEEMTSSISSLSHRAEFGIVAFSTLAVAFSDKPSRATINNKSQAIAWVQALEASGLTRMLDGALILLPVAEQSRKKHRVIIVLSDGLPNGPGPEETLSGILAANDESIPMNTILIGAGPEAVAFMTDLAAATGGKFSHLEGEE
ncbi:MAG: VWA domain-containing protein [Planctomycetes bacterium]|nr:VWA domain-containing protein [Planctomycetota bacterium]